MVCSAFRDLCLVLALNRRACLQQESKVFAAENFGALTASGEWNGQFGRYPPALDETLAQAKNFQQLEDFNLKRCVTWTLDFFVFPTICVT